MFACSSATSSRRRTCSLTKWAPLVLAAYQVVMVNTGVSYSMLSGSAPTWPVLIAGDPTIAGVDGHDGGSNEDKHSLVSSKPVIAEGGVVLSMVAIPQGLRPSPYRQT